MKYPNYTSSTLKDIVDNPRGIADNPYKLLVSFVINSIHDDFSPDDETQSPYGLEIPTCILDKYIDECVMDFIETGEHGGTISIKGIGYRIRKFRSFKYNDARASFSFQHKGQYSIITENGIFDVQSKVSSTNEERHTTYDANRFYFWKIMILGKDDEGYDKLTDMEAAIYCWALWIKKQPLSDIINKDKIKKWWERDYEYFQIPLNEIVGCMNQEMLDANKANTYFIFDYDSVNKWNETHNQLSEAKSIQDTKAYDNWYRDTGKKFCRV